MQRLNYRHILVLPLLLWSISSFAQLTAPGRNWADLTKYVINPTKQDSIFTFFGNTGTLKAQHTTSNLSTFNWYKYNPNIAVPANRFELFHTETNQIASEITNLAEGGYRVVVTDNTDSIEIFTAWVFTDNVVLSRVDADSQCEFLVLTAVSSPVSYNIEYDRFVYYDLSRVNSHPENNTYGKGYFKQVDWVASESRVEFSQSGTLRQTIQNPAPLYNSTYTVDITNIFGRVLTLQTPTINAIAAKAIQKVQVNKDGSWADYDSNSSDGYEALLELRVESSSVNCDSLYWFLLRQKSSLDYDYNTIWRDSSLLASRVESFPPKDLLRPAYFKVKHLVVNTSSGCKDSVELEVKVDSAKISPEAIPNVFLPNGGPNSKFRFVDSEGNKKMIQSIQSFSIWIFTRSGRLVYEYSGGNPREWEGWDGKVKGTGAIAPDGVYFFVIEAKGWDGREFDYGPYKGFLHLFGSKK